MALTQIQQTNKNGYPHYTNYPIWVVYSSSVVNSHFGFKYKFKVYDDTNTEIFSTLKAPDKNGNGAFDLQDLSKTMICNDFNFGLFYTNVPEYFKEYKIKVSEYFDGAEHSEVTLLKNLASGLKMDGTKGVGEYFNSKINTEYFTEREIGTTYSEALVGRGGIGFLNGNVITASANVKGLKFRFTYSDGTVLTYDRPISIAQQDFNTGTALGNKNNTAVYIHTSLGAIEGENLYRVPGYVSEHVPNLEDIVSYEAESYDSTDTLSGDIFKFKMVRSCNEDSFNLVWENSYNMLEYFPFIGVTDIDNSGKKVMYEHNSIDINASTGIYSLDDATDVTPLSITVDRTYGIRTHYINEKETELLKSLIGARKTYLSNSDGLIPVINTELNLIEKNTAGLASYELTFNYSKKINA